MKQAPLVMNPANMERASTTAQIYVHDILARAEKIKEDAQKDIRVSEQECKACFYVRSKVGGSAMTSRACMCCGSDVLYGSTCTDVLCKDCAKENKLCKHCGGDINMKVRKTWPKAKLANG